MLLLLSTTLTHFTCTCTFSGRLLLRTHSWQPDLNQAILVSECNCWSNLALLSFLNSFLNLIISIIVNKFFNFFFYLTQVPQKVYKVFKTRAATATLACCSIISLSIHCIQQTEISSYIPKKLSYKFILITDVMSMKLVSETKKCDGVNKIL